MALLIIHMVYIQFHCYFVLIGGCGQVDARISQVEAFGAFHIEPEIVLLESVVSPIPSDDALSVT